MGDANDDAQRRIRPDDDYDDYEYDDDEYDDRRDGWQERWGMIVSGHRKGG